MGTLNDELRMLLSSEISAQISKMEDCTGQLDQTATYCEMMYKQSHNKAEAFNVTKKLTLQSLASVAYYVTSLSEALLRSLDLETENLAGKTMEARNVSQIVAIQREKSARREIGKLTISRNVTRKNKITYPVFEEKAVRYQRTPIDYSLLDGIGHGRQSAPQSSDYSSTLNRSGSMVSNDYGTYGSGVYADYAGRVGAQTLTRQSIRSMAADQHQYRMPQLIPSALDAHQHHQKQIYQQLPVQQQSQQQMCLRMNSQDVGGNNNNAVNGHGRQSNNTNNYHHLNHEMSELSYADAAVNNDLAYDGEVAPLRSQAATVSAPAHTLNRIRQPPPPQVLVQNSNNGHHSQLHYSAPTGYENGDCLPPPPSSSDHSTLPHADDPLPPPPPNIGGAPQLGIDIELVPAEYVEKARVIYAYEAKQPDELTLVEGAVVYVLIKNEDGWYEGVTDGVTGLFPGNYVAPIDM